MIWLRDHRASTGLVKHRVSKLGPARATKLGVVLLFLCAVVPIMTWLLTIEAQALLGALLS